MEIKGKSGLRELVQKVGIWRLLVMVAAGVLLLLLSLPAGESESGQEENETADSEEIALDAMQSYANRQEKELEEILSKVDGVGKVKVKLTLASSEEKITLQDQDNSQDDTSEQDQAGGSRTTEKQEQKKETVLVQGDEGESPYVVQIASPKIEGVLVVAEGLDSSKMETEIIEAVQALFSVETHKIKVMKME